MKSSIKKILSVSMTSLTVFSSLGGLSTVKINAAPRAYTSEDKIAKKSKIEFTFGDIIDFYSCSRETRKDIPKLVNRIPNIFNLLRIDRDIELWADTIFFLADTSLDIIYGEQSHNYNLEDVEALKYKRIPVGHTLNELRKWFKGDGYSEGKCYQIVIEFMKNYLGMTDDDHTKNLFKKFRKVVEMKREICSLVRQSNELDTNIGIRCLIEKINNSEKIRSGIEDPHVKKMVDTLLEGLKAKENLLTREPDISPDTMEAKKKAFYDAADRLERMIVNMPRIILAENLKDFEEKKLENESKSLGEEENYFEDMSKEEILERERQIKIAEEIKAKLIKIINSSDPDKNDKLDKAIEEMNTRINDPELLGEVRRFGQKTLEEHKKAMLEEFSATMSRMLDLVKNLGNKSKAEEPKKECESPQEDKKDVQQPIKEEKVFTFGDLNEWMQNEKSQEKFELKMMEVCDFIDTVGNRGIWYTCLDQFEKCFQSLTEDFTEEEKTEISKKVAELPIAGIFNKLRQAFMDHLPEEEYLKAVSEFLGVPMKVKPAEEAKEEPIKQQESNSEVSAKNSQEIKEKPAEIKPQEEAKEEPIEQQKSNLEVSAENSQEIKEKPAEIKPAKKAEQPKITPKEENAHSYNKPETIAKNQSNSNFKPAIPSIKQEKAEKKKSFWSFILDLLEKLPLIGKLIHFLRK